MEINVLRLDKLIDLKRALARPKDLALLPVLEATLKEATKSKRLTCRTQIAPPACFRACDAR